MGAWPFFHRARRRRRDAGFPEAAKGVQIPCQDVRPTILQRPKQGAHQHADLCGRLGAGPRGGRSGQSERALGGSLPAGHALPAPSTPQKDDESANLARTPGEASESMCTSPPPPAESVEDSECRSTALADDDDRSPSRLASTMQLGFDCEELPNSSAEHSVPEASADMDEVGCSEEGALPSPVVMSPRPRLPQALRERPQALRDFPPIEAFTDWGRYDAGDTLKSLRRWARYAQPWDLSAVADWLEEEQRKDVIKFLTRICEERRLYRAQSRELLTQLLSIKEWVTGESVVDEDAIAESFYHTGVAPMYAWPPTPVASPNRSMTESSATSLPEFSDDLKFWPNQGASKSYGASMAAAGSLSKALPPSLHANGLPVLSQNGYG